MDPVSARPDASDGTAPTQDGGRVGASAASGTSARDRRLARVREERRRRKYDREHTYPGWARYSILLLWRSQVQIYHIHDNESILLLIFSFYRRRSSAMRRMRILAMRWSRSLARTRLEQRDGGGQTARGLGQELQQATAAEGLRQELRQAAAVEGLVQELRRLAVKGLEKELTGRGVAGRCGNHGELGSLAGAEITASWDC